MNEDKVLALGREFDAVAAAIDAATKDVSPPPSVMTALLEKLGPLDPAAGSTTDQLMALSIIRDLIRLFEPSLERPGALAELVRE